MDGQYDFSVDDLVGGGCKDALETLYYFLDGELTAARRAVIQHHLDQCAPCLHAFDFEAELRSVVARSCREEVPDALRKRVADVIAEASNPQQQFPGGFEQGFV